MPIADLFADRLALQILQRGYASPFMVLFVCNSELSSYMADNTVYKNHLHVSLIVLFFFRFFVFPQIGIL